MPQWERGRSPATGERRARTRRQRTSRAEQRLAEVAEQQAELDAQIVPIEPPVVWSSGEWSRVAERQSTPRPTGPVEPARDAQRWTLGEAAWMVLVKHYSLKRAAERVGCSRQVLRVYVDLYAWRDR